MVLPRFLSVLANLGNIGSRHHLDLALRHRLRSTTQLYNPRLSVSSLIRARAASTTSTMAAADDLKAVGNFNLLQRLKLDVSDITVSQWRSSASGLRVVHLDYDGSFLHLV